MPERIRGSYDDALYKSYDADISSPCNLRNFISDMFSNDNITYDIIVHMFIYLSFSFCFMLPFWWNKEEYIQIDVYFSLLYFSAFSWIYSPLNLSEWHALTRDHTVLPATHTLIHEWNEPSCLWSPAAAHHRTLVVLVPQWLVTYWGGMLARRKSPVPVPTDR